MGTSLWAGADKGETGTVDSLLYLQLARHPLKAPLKDKTPQKPPNTSGLQFMCQ